MPAKWQQVATRVYKKLKKARKVPAILGPSFDSWSHQGPLEGTRTVKKRVSGGYPKKVWKMGLLVLGSFQRPRSPFFLLRAPRRLLRLLRRGSKCWCPFLSKFGLEGRRRGGPNREQALIARWSEDSEEGLNTSGFAYAADLFFMFAVELQDRKSISNRNQQTETLLSVDFC